MKDDFQVHEIIRTAPLNIDPPFVVILVDIFEVFLHITYALLDMIVIIGLVIEGLYWNIHKDD